MPLHDMQFVAINFSDGSVGVMQFVLDPRLPEGCVVPGYDPETGRRDATDEAIEYEILKSAWGELVPVSWMKIDQDAVPADRTFRNAWELQGTRIGHNMPKVRGMHLDRLREERKQAFAELDAEFTMALGQKRTQDIETIEALREAWRNMPDTVAKDLEAAQTPEAVAAIGFTPAL